MHLIIPEAFDRTGQGSKDNRKYNRGAFYGSNSSDHRSYFYEEQKGYDNIVLHAKDLLSSYKPDKRFIPDDEWKVLSADMSQVYPCDFNSDGGHTYFGLKSTGMTAYPGWHYARHAHFNGLSVYVMAEVNNNHWPHEYTAGEVPIPPGVINCQIEYWMTKPSSSVNFARIACGVDLSFCMVRYDMLAGLVTRSDQSSRGLKSTPPKVWTKDKSAKIYIPWFDFRIPEPPPHESKGYKEACEIIGDAVYAGALKMIIPFYKDVFLPAPVSGGGRVLQVKESMLLDLPDLEKSFLFNEVELIRDKVDPIALGVRGGAYMINTCKQHAFIAALEDAPRMNQNSIQNIMELVSFIKGIVVDKRIDIPSSLSDAWLAYRYSYSTTKMDLEEAIRFMKRNVSLDSLLKGYTCYGVYNYSTSSGIDVQCRARLRLKSQEIVNLEKVSSALFKYGLSPDFYVVWDAIPYSFIVDWFIPVGDMLGVIDYQNEYLSGNYKISDLVYSLKYVHSVDGVDVQCYSRWVDSPPQDINEFYWLVSPKASSKTTLFRFLDAASLTLGR